MHRKKLNAYTTRTPPGLVSVRLLAVVLFLAPNARGATLILTPLVFAANSKPPLVTGWFTATGSSVSIKARGQPVALLRLCVRAVVAVRCACSVAITGSGLDARRKNSSGYAVGQAPALRRKRARWLEKVCC